MIIDIYKNQVKLMVGAEARKASLMQIDSEHPEERVEASLGDEYSDDAWFSHQCRQGVDMLASELHKFVEVVDEPEPEPDPTDDEPTNDEPTNNESTDEDPIDVDVNGDEPTEEEPYGDNQESTTENPGVTTKWRLRLTLNNRRKVWPNLMASSFERFLVYYVLNSWTSMTMPSLADRYAGLRNEALDEIKRTIYRKEFPVL